MQCPLTISILPNHEHSKEIAEEALQRGYQVMLHLPMQSVAKRIAGKGRVETWDDRPASSNDGWRMIESVPNAVGVNNHQGSQGDIRRGSHGRVNARAAKLGFVYVDSRTTAATVAFDAAKRDGVPAAFRNVPFLDDVQDAAAIRKQLEFALRGAKEKKAAIAIGHPHPETLKALREFLPTARAKGVRLVFASELVH